MPVNVIPAFIVSVTCDKCKKAVPDAATIPIGVAVVKDRMEKAGWAFQDSVLLPDTPPTATCPECNKLLVNQDDCDAEKPSGIALQVVPGDPN